MKITYSKSFDKNFKSLERYEQEYVLEAITLFKENPYHPALRNHSLTGSMTWKRSISAWEDLRIIFIEKWDYIQVLMLDVWWHNEVYLN